MYEIRRSFQGFVTIFCFPNMGIGVFGLRCIFRFERTHDSGLITFEFPLMKDGIQI